MKIPSKNCTIYIVNEMRVICDLIQTIQLFRQLLLKKIEKKSCLNHWSQTFRLRPHAGIEWFIEMIFDGRAYISKFCLE